MSDPDSDHHPGSPQNEPSNPLHHSPSGSNVTFSSLDSSNIDLSSLSSSDLLPARGTAFQRAIHEASGLQAEYIEAEILRRQPVQEHNGDVVTRLLLEVRVGLPREPGERPRVHVEVFERREHEDVDEGNAGEEKNEKGEEKNDKEEGISSKSLGKENIRAQVKAQLPVFALSFVSGILAATLFQQCGGVAAMVGLRSWAMRIFGKQM